MSARTKKHPTRGKPMSSILYVVDNENFYAIPEHVAARYKVEVKRGVHKKGNVKAEDIFSKLDERVGKAASLLKGLRSRENLSQVEFAKKIGVSQANLSKMENGSRPIGKTIAKRIANAFSVNYRYFLE